MGDEDKVETPAAGEARKEKDEGKTEEDLGGRMTFLQHLEELRRRLIVSLLTVAGVFMVIYSSPWVYDPIRKFFMQPLQDVVKNYGTFQFTSIAEGFEFNVKLSAAAAVFISAPMLFYQAWAFIAPGLYKKERRYVAPFIFFSTFFFLAGSAFFYFIAFPMGARFFASFAQADLIQFNPKLDDTFSFVTVMVMAFGLIFELPLIAFILARLHIINIALMNKYRRWAILLIFIIAAIITPPDVLSQILVALPMWALYEVSALVVWIFGPKAKKPGEETIAEKS